MQAGSIKQKENRRTICRIKNYLKINPENEAKNRHKKENKGFRRVGNIPYLAAGLFWLIAGLCCLLASPALAQSPENNGYVADKPLELYIHDTVQGDLYYTVGNSYYSGKVYPGDIYSVNLNVNLPEGATVKFARLYAYWTWSAEGIQGRYPEMKLSFNGEELTPEREYTDRKGWGIYDYPTGTWAYDVSDRISGSGTFVTDLENTGSGASYVCFDGAGLLIVYTDPNGKYIEYWVSEGADMLNSQVDENDNPLYYTTPDQTICEMLKPTLQLPFRSATLWTITQSGNWEDNTLLVNEEKFPGICNGKPYPDLDIDVREIKDYLKSGENSILFQAIGDYVVPSGTFLVIERDSLAGVTQASTGETSENPEETDPTPEASETRTQAETSEKETEKAPGFEFISTLVFLTGGKLIAGYRKQEARE
ncbi:Cell surface glycoprotein [Methanosarcina horonobensis HB-1 = JCM 15518]|uniref:Cell surface glycoprotein n=1 Tax=Methanosarcina horonobensis HB-1 = JCM 15518 TaxID=1434110 RepID=A0A0E3SGD3_9EURY|nr:DUF3344 domain-containing protein [Methanosarcina horonobensis]AKB79407.1 Cell surface glycoprotein [Methanosarcina horonobensis HB-1 = JCM 15518]